MPALLFKWLLIPAWLFSSQIGGGRHPIYVSVTEIEHNAKAKTLEVSCKIFTDDFEKALRNAYNTHVDLEDVKIKTAMDKHVNDYVKKHLQITVDGKAATLAFIGFERIDEGIYSYFEATGIAAVKKIAVKDDILFEYKKEQISLVHVIVGGNRKSTKINNPGAVAELVF